MKMKKCMQDVLPSLVWMAALAAVARHDAPGMDYHSGGELSMCLLLLTLIAGTVLCVHALRRRRWLRAAAMAAVIAFSIGCGEWLVAQTPPCPDCEPALYAEWLEENNEG